MQFDLRPALVQLHDMVNTFFAALPRIVVAVIVFTVFYVIAKGLRSLVRRASNNRHRHRNLGLVLGRLTQAAAILLGLLVALVIALPGFTPSRLVELLGIGSIAIGFAFRDILQNFLAGILLLLTEPFRIGDQIVVNNFEGTVEDIQTRATTIRTYDGKRVVIPNSNLFTQSVTVNTALDKRRLEYNVGIGYGDDIDKAKSLILEAIRGVDGVLSDPLPDVIVVDLADFNVVLRARWWVHPPQRANVLDMQDQVLTVIKKTLQANGIDLPFPTQQILFHDQTEATDGDRTQQREGWPGGKTSPRPRSIAAVLEARREVRSVVGTQE